MDHRHERRHEPNHLRALLTLSRELMQADEMREVLGLAGHAMAHLTRLDGALLVLRTDGEQVFGFDRAGSLVAAQPSHPWYRSAAKMLDDAGQARGAPDDRQAFLCGQGQRMLLLRVPAIAALAVGWQDDGGAHAWDQRRDILYMVLELTVAALGKIQTRSALEDLVSAQYGQMADTAQAHEAELARRDLRESEMRVLSLTDVLTGLNNRRGFFAHAEQVFKVAQRRQAPSAVIFADIDGLKLVNDELGHDAGDSLIRDAASVFRESFRDADVLARLGADEFVAYTLDDALPAVILARLDDNLRAFNLMQERPYRVAFSTGIVPCSAGNDLDLLAYVMLADRQMYAHKRRRLH